MADVILVDERDNQIGVEEKLKAHQKGSLHRCFSIFVFNSKSELMLQKRAKSKYHSGGLWTNTCCSHPAPGENLEQSAHKRLEEEMGFDCKLKEIFTFIYKAKVERLTENEFDHVLFGNYDGTPSINPEEADDWKWSTLGEIENEIRDNPQNYTVWFKIALPRVKEALKEI